MSNILEELLNKIKKEIKIKFDLTTPMILMELKISRHQQRKMKNRLIDEKYKIKSEIQLILECKKNFPNITREDIIQKYPDLKYLDRIESFIPTLFTPIFNQFLQEKAGETGIPIDTLINSITIPNNYSETSRIYLLIQYLSTTNFIQFFCLKNKNFDIESVPKNITNMRFYIKIITDTIYDYYKIGPCDKKDFDYYVNIFCEIESLSYWKIGALITALCLCSFKKRNIEVKSPPFEGIIEYQNIICSDLLFGNNKDFYCDKDGFISLTNIFLCMKSVHFDDDVKSELLSAIYKKNIRGYCNESTNNELKFRFCNFGNILRICSTFISNYST